MAYYENSEGEINHYQDEDTICTCTVIYGYVDVIGQRAAYTHIDWIEYEHKHTVELILSMFQIRLIENRVILEGIHYDMRTIVMSLNIPSMPDGVHLQDEKQAYSFLSGSREIQVAVYSDGFGVRYTIVLDPIQSPLRKLDEVSIVHDILLDPDTLR
jgi:hypothetical protein